MKKITIVLNYFNQTRQYYIFKPEAQTKPETFLPEKIYLRKDLFEKEVKTIKIVIEEA